MLRVIETVEKQIERDPWITEQEAEDLCCEPADMPSCLEKSEDWAGYTEQEILDRLGIATDNGRDAAGNLVDVRLLNRNLDGLCGEQITKQQAQQKPCCDGVSSIEWDSSRSIDVIADNSSGVVYVTGGKPPYIWSVRGNGFYLTPSGTYRDGETDLPWAKIYTFAACGTCSITVTDGCSSASGHVRSVNGKWDGDCVYLETDTSISGTLGWYEEVYYDPATCSICRGTYHSVTAPGTVVRPNSNLRVWNGSSWDVASFGCLISGNRNMSLEEFNAELAKVQVPLLPSASPSEENSCPGSSNPCRWVC